LIVPVAVRARAVSQGADAWLAGLDDQVGELCAEWRLRLGRVLDGGTASLVVEVTCADGSPAVLKLALPDVGFHDQLRLLELADGRGYVRVLRADHERNAALLESLGGRLSESGLEPAEQIAVVCDLLQVAWQVPRERYLEQPWNNADELASLITDLWDRHDHPCPQAVVDHALECARRRAAVPREQWVVVHADPHPNNVLQVRRDRDGSVGGYVFVDPTGFLADPSYDVGILMRDWTAQLLGDAAADAPGWLARQCALAAARTGLDQDAVWEWAYVERVSSGLFLIDCGDRDQGHRFLQTAELLLRRESDTGSLA
jgi:streptomycin 6-kinase